LLIPHRYYTHKPEGLEHKPVFLHLKPEHVHLWGLFLDWALGERGMRSMLLTGIALFILACDNKKLTHFVAFNRFVSAPL